MPCTALAHRFAPPATQTASRAAPRAGGSPRRARATASAPTARLATAAARARRASRRATARWARSAARADAGGCRTRSATAAARCRATARAIARRAGCRRGAGDRGAPGEAVRNWAVSGRPRHGGGVQAGVRQRRRLQVCHFLFLVLLLFFNMRLRLRHLLRYHVRPVALAAGGRRDCRGALRAVDAPSPASSPLSLSGTR